MQRIRAMTVITRLVIIIIVRVIIIGSMIVIHYYHMIIIIIIIPIAPRIPPLQPPRRDKMRCVMCLVS